MVHPASCAQVVLERLDAFLGDLDRRNQTRIVKRGHGEAMDGTDDKDLDETPEKTAQTTATMVTNAVHLARLLNADPYPSLQCVEASSAP